MRRKSYRQRLPVAKILAAALFLAVLTILIFGLSQTRQSVESEGLRLAEQSIRRAAVVCYSIESRYPDSYEYLAANYGVSVDLEEYIVHYDIFASNIMPDIMVVKR